MEYVTVGRDEVPALGLGTWLLEGNDCRQAVIEALDLGYRHIDTAQAYDNESEIGAALQTHTIDRDELWITTKVANPNHAPSAVRRSTEESLRQLGTEHVDLLLVHWPVEFESMPATLEAMLRLRDEGKARYVGVSNFTPTQLELALELAPVAAIQVEYHLFLSQAELLGLVRKHDLMLTAYSPLARGRVQRDGVLREIAERHHKTPAQVALRWLLDQERVTAIPKATSREHLSANLAVFDFVLTDEERERINALARPGGRIIDPDWSPDWGA